MSDLKLSNISALQKKVEKEEKELTEIEEILQRIEECGDTYIYIKSQAKYYWVQQEAFFSHSETASNLQITPKQLTELRKYYIPEYTDFVYKQWWREGYYNLLDESKILLPSDTPVLHPDIEHLIYCVCWGKEENITYLHQALLYKYTHINDFTLPAVVFYGQWGSWKGTFVSLLWTIFWEENVLANLWQRDITWSFDTYRGNKIAVEFAEITTNNTHKDIWVTNKLKNIIGAEKITINEKHVRQRQIENIAWFFISSNSRQPLRLDDKSVWNRRFSVMQSSLKLQNGDRVNKTVRQEGYVAEFLRWLLSKYPGVLKMDKFEALDNKDKRELEECSQSEVNSFWSWCEDNQPNFSWKKSIKEIYSLLDIYCIENELDLHEIKKYFWSHSKYQKKKIRIGEKTLYWVDIPLKEWVNIEEIKEIFD